MATTIPITTNTTIATCVQIQNGDIASNSLLGRLANQAARWGLRATKV